MTSSSIPFPAVPLAKYDGGRLKAFSRTRGRSSPAPAKLLDLSTRAASTPPDIDPHRQQLCKKKSQYFANAFAYREPNNCAKDRVMKDSMVVADIKLNCQLEPEQSFLSDLSFQLSEIYQRPESSIMLTVSPKTSMVLGGTSEPAYHMSIAALSSEIAPTKNKRSTALIQDFMEECLGIASKRGVIRFESVAEENLASNGMTALQEIEELEARSSEDNGVLRGIVRNRSKKGKKDSTPIFTGAITPPDTDAGGSTDASDLLEGRKMKRRKSILAFFSRG